jgi:L-fucose isomerase-like protein
VSFHWWITTKIQRLGLLAMGGSSYGLNQWCGFKQNMGKTEEVVSEMEGTYYWRQNSNNEIDRC